MKKIPKIALTGILLTSLAGHNANLTSMVNSEYNILFPEEIKEEINIPEEVAQEARSAVSEVKKNLSADYKTNNFHDDSNEVLLARMIFGECRNCSKAEKIAVAYTIINRMNDNNDWNGKTLKEVILKPYQYSAFNKDRNFKLKNPMKYNAKEFLNCFFLAKEILQGKYKDPTQGATHYLNPDHPDLKGRQLPKWARELKSLGRVENGYHIFYKKFNS